MYQEHTRKSSAPIQVSVTSTLVHVELWLGRLTIYRFRWISALPLKLASLKHFWKSITLAVGSTSAETPATSALQGLS